MLVPSPSLALTPLHFGLAWPGLTEDARANQTQGSMPPETEMDQWEWIDAHHCWAQCIFQVIKDQIIAESGDPQRWIKAISCPLGSCLTNTVNCTEEDHFRLKSG